MAAELLADLSRATDANSNPLAGAKWYFYATGTTTPQTVYADVDLSTPLSNPVVADAGGQFVAIFFDSALQYRGVLKTAGGATIKDLDPINTGIMAQLSEPSGSSEVGFIQSGTGAVARTVQDKARERISVTDFGAVGNGIANDTAALLATAVAARGTPDTPSRTPAGEIHLPRGSYKIQDVLELGGADGIYGMIISGDADGGTEIVFGNAAATIKVSNSLAITWRDVRFTAALGVDGDQAAFTINYSSGNPLLNWRFDRCSFVEFYKCFAVTGSAMCDGFHFTNCGFYQCYWLMDNDNDQAVNWNFVNCDWVNNELTTVKSKSVSTPLLLRKGTFIKWTGGSIISYGPLVYYNLLVSAVFQGNSHKTVFDGVRIERVDDAGSCSPLFDRPEGGTYSVPGNSPSAALINSTVLSRGTIPSTVTHFKVWDNVKFIVDNCEIETGKIVGVYGALSGANTGDFTLRNTTPLPYEEDVTGRVSDHIAHNVTIEPDTRGAVVAPAFQQRSRSLSTPVSLAIQTLSVCGPTGSIPLGGTTVNLPEMNDHTTLLRLVVRKFAAGVQSLTVDLRDQADTTTYGTVTLAGADRAAYGEINAEIGFQITDPLMLKFTGTPEVMKGLAYLEYL